MSRKTFNGLYRLEELKMDHSNITYLPNEWLESLHFLEVLTLKQNDFYTVPKLSLPTLKQLDLAYNPITEITDGVFKGLPKLEILKLHNMEFLWEIEEDAFMGLERLQVLMINECPELFVIHEEAFGKNPRFRRNIDVIDLQSNKLNTLSEKLLPWDKVNTLKLSGNPWFCDCNLKWMNDEKLTTKFQNTPPICFTPESMAGKMVTLMEPSDFKCSRLPSALNPGKTAIFLVLMFVAAAGVACAYFVFVVGCKDRHRLLHNSGLGGPTFGYRNLIMRAEEPEDIIIGPQSDKKPKQQQPREKEGDSDSEAEPEFV